MMLELDADVPANHELTLTLPPEVPEGRVRLQVTWEAEPLPGGYRRRDLHPSLVPEEDAYVRMLPELLRTHLGKYVGIHGGELVAAASTKMEALRAANRCAPKQAMYFLQEVSDRPRPIERLPSIREIRGAMD